MSQISYQNLLLTEYCKFFMTRVRSTNRENEVGNMASMSIGNWSELKSTPRSQGVRALEYEPLNQPITAHVFPERYK